MIIDKQRGNNNPVDLEDRFGGGGGGGGGGGRGQAAPSDTTFRENIGLPQQPAQSQGPAGKAEK